MDFEPSDYRIPGGNAVTLSTELANEIKTRFFRDRDNRFHIYLLAAGLRKTYLRTSEGGKDSYSQEFREWYSKNKLEKHFGLITSSFSRYATAGSVIEYVAKGAYFDTANRPSNVPAPDPTRYLEALPLAISALYEIHQIIRDPQIDHGTFRALFSSTPRRQSSDQSIQDLQTKTPDKKALIHPDATAAELLLWHKNWVEPPQRKQKRTDKRTLMLAAVTVSGELYDMNRDGDHAGCVKLDEVRECLARLEQLTNELNGGDLKFRVLGNLDYLELGVTTRQQRLDYGRHAQTKEKEKKAIAKRKAAIEKARAAGKKPPKRKKPKPVDPRTLRALDLSGISGIVK